jgi:hypothetical protein
MKNTNYPYIHGKTGTSEFYTWDSMRQRCLNPLSKPYKNYGGRGITICSRWKKSFINFLNDMGPRPSSNHSLDRINNNKGYTPKNCRWATRKEQASNTRSNVSYTFKGCTKTLTQWADFINVSKDTLWRRLNVLRWPLKRALTTPTLTSVQAGIEAAKIRWRKKD